MGSELEGRRHLAAQALRTVVALFAAGAVAAAAAAPTKIVARITVGLAPCAEVEGFGAVWVANYGSSTLSRLDPNSNRVLRTVKVGASPCGLAAGAGAIWVDGYGTGTVERVDPKTMRRVASIPAGLSVWDVAFDGRHVWADANGDGTVVEIDPHSNRVVRRFKVGGAPTGLAVADGSLWIGNNGYGDRTFFRLDLGTGSVHRVSPGCLRPAYFAVRAGDDPWLTCVGVTRGEALRIDAATNRVVARVRLGHNPGDGAIAADGSVFIPNKSDGTVTRIDSRTNRIAGTIRTGGAPFVINAAFGDVWVPDNLGTQVWRLRP